MANLMARETYYNATDDYCIDQTGWYETFATDPGDLFRACRAEFGRCRSKVYAERPDGDVAVGWVFVKREPFVDSGDTYLRETWVEYRPAERTPA
jgi:hypothetical protein